VTPAVALLNLWTNKAVPTFADFFPVFTLYTASAISPEGTVKLKWAGQGAQRPVLRGYKPQKRVRSSKRRTRGINPLVFYI
jgi:hypothetical protein